MKKRMKRVITGAWVLALLLTLILPGAGMVKATESAGGEAPAEGGTKIYYYNENSWENVYLWAWTMEDNVNLAANAWPGDAMTDIGDGWFSFELSVDTGFGILFNDGNGAQTADCKDIEAGKTVWFTNGSEELANDSGMGGGVTVVPAAEPKAGWPEGPPADDSAAEPEAGTGDAADDENDAAAPEVTAPEAGTNAVPYIIIGIVVVAAVVGIAVVVRKKNKK